MNVPSEIGSIRSPQTTPVPSAVITHLANSGKLGSPAGFDTPAATGRPQVVTTNFDHLFERVDKSLSVHIAPALPDIRSVGSFEGLAYVPGPPLFSLLKRHFLGAFESVALWNWDEHTRNKLVEFLVVACLWKRENKAYVSYVEARTALRAVDDAARSHALWFLENLVEEAGTWSSFGRHFVQRAWPRESRYQTPGVARQFAFLAERSGDDFPDVVRTVLPLVVSTDQLDLTVHHAAEQSEASLARRFPESMLQLLDRLVPDEPRPIPYDLGVVLNLIADASPSLRGDRRWRRLRRIADRS